MPSRPHLTSPSPLTSPARLLRSAVLGVALLAPAALAPTAALAQAAPAAQKADEVQVPEELQSMVEDFWHYGKIARYDLAAAKGQAILDSKPEPRVALQAFEDVARGTGVNRNDLSELNDRLFRWQGEEVDSAPMKEVTAKIQDLLNQGRFGRREDPQFIASQVERLGGGSFAYARAMENLRRSGELAVPVMLDYLQNPAKTELHADIRRGLKELGLLAVNPLLAATEAKDTQLLTTVMLTLGEIGYNAAVPYLERVIQSPDYPGPIKAAAGQALADIGGQQAKAPAAEQFYDLAQQFYNGTTAVKPDVAGPMASVWHMEGNRLIRTQVPPEIFDDLMAMREAEYALKLGGQGKYDTDAALALWLASNYKREVDLPEGKPDATRGANQPDANYYGVTSGAKYLYQALDRALKDRNSAVALKIIGSLQEIVGQAGLQGGAQKDANDPAPLIRALTYRDRRVRYESAFTLAAALPTQGFTGQNQVVPLLTEALGESGKTTVLLVMPSLDKVNALAEPLRQAGFIVQGGAGPQAADAAAAQLPAVDVMVIDSSLPPTQVDQAISLTDSNAKLRYASKLILTDTGASPYASVAAADPSFSTTTAKDAKGLVPQIGLARSKAGQLPMDEQTATGYATRAGELLRRLAIDSGDVYDVTAGKSGLLASLNDPRPQIVTLAGDVLGLVDTDGVQPALLARATDDKLAEEVRVGLFKSLAANARRFGDKLDSSQTAKVDEVVKSAENLELRSAAADARGALNLPADEAKTLILDQSKIASMK